VSYRTRGQQAVAATHHRPAQLARVVIWRHTLPTGSDSVSAVADCYADSSGGAVSIPDEVIDQFSAGTRTDLVRFVRNDAVRVTSGTNKTRTGVVLSIFSLEPTTYLIEASVEPWGDFQAAESDIEPCE
jgi:hypothetical protein